MTQTATAHIAQLRRLLKIEYEAEKEALTRIADRTEVSRLVDRGMAWWPITHGNVYFNSLNQRIIEVYRSADTDPETEHEFDYGRSVVFFTASGTAGDTPRRLFGGTVSYVDGNRMAVAIADTADISLLDSDGRRAGVMLSFDETTYRVMFETASTSLPRQKDASANCATTSIPTGPSANCLSRPWLSPISMPRSKEV